MLSRQTSAARRTCQDTEFSAVCYSMGRSQEQEEVSSEEGRKVGRKMEDRSGCSSPRAFPPLLSCYPPPQDGIVHVGSDILTTCTAPEHVTMSHPDNSEAARQDLCDGVLPGHGVAVLQEGLVIPILQTGKLRLRESTGHIQGHTAH